MKTGLRFLFILLLALSFVGCASTAHKQQVAVSKGVYATQSAIKAGRFDLAKRYNDETARLLPPPKKAVAVKPVVIKGQQTIIVPSDLGTLPVATIDAPAVTLAISQDKRLQGQLEAENRALNKFSGEADTVLREKAAEAEKYEAQKPSLVHRILTGAKWLALPLLAVGIVALVVFCPASIPFLVAAWKFLTVLAAVAFRAIAALLVRIFKPNTS